MAQNADALMRMGPLLRKQQELSRKQGSLPASRDCIEVLGAVLKQRILSLLVVKTQVGDELRQMVQIL